MTLLAEAKRIWTLILGIMISMMGLTIISPVLPLYAREFGVSRTATGALIAAFALSRLAFDFVGGYLNDRFPARSIMFSSALLLSISSATAALAPDYTTLLVSRFIEGAGSAGFATAAMSVIVKTTNRANLGRTTALYQFGLLFGVAVGPSVGGLLAAIGDYTTPFWAYAGLGVVLCVIALLGDFPPPNPSKQSSYRSNAMNLLRNKAFLGVLFAAFALFVMRLGARIALFPLYATEDLGYGPGTVGLLMAVPAVVNLVVVAHAGLVTDKYGATRVIAIGLVLSGIATAMLGSVASLLALTAVSVLLGFGSAYGSVAAPSLAAQLATEGEEGVAVGTYRGAGDLGAVVGPLLLTSVAESGHFGTGFLISGALLLAAAVVALVTSKETV